MLKACEEVYFIKNNHEFFDVLVLIKKRRCNEGKCSFLHVLIHAVLVVRRKNLYSSFLCFCRYVLSITISLKDDDRKPCDEAGEKNVREKMPSLSQACPT